MVYKNPLLYACVVDGCHQLNIGFIPQDFMDARWCRISAINSFGVLLFKAAGADDFYLFSTAEDWGLLGHGLHSNDCFCFFF